MFFDSPSPYRTSLLHHGRRPGHLQMGFQEVLTPCLRPPARSTNLRLR